MSLSLFGIILGLVLLMFLAYKGYSIIWVAPVCAVVVAVLSGYAILDAYIGDYMKGMADYVLQWFPAFFLGAVYGKVMDLTGSARSLGNALVKLIGPRFAVAAVVIPCLLMTYGGISLFVVVFVIYPMGYSIYRAADLPRTLLPGAIATGAFGITMTAVPGTPQIQNLIPTDYYGTTTMAAPLLSLVACAVMLLPAYIYLEWRVRQSRRKGLHFVPDPKHKEVDHDSKALPSWHWVTGIVPLVVVVLMLNLFPWLLNRFAGIELASNYAIVIALVGGILVACLLNLNQAKTLLPAINEGANGSMGAIMNTACAVGFGSVVKVVPGFASLTSIALNMPGSILFSEAVAVNLLAGATGSASGGMSIALSALGPKYAEMAAGNTGVLEALHRIASISSGGLDTLPHNGAVLTLLAVSNCTHKESYIDICITTCIIPLVSSLGLALIWGLFLCSPSAHTRRRPHHDHSAIEAGRQRQPLQDHQRDRRVPFRRYHRRSEPRPCQRVRGQCLPVRRTDCPRHPQRRPHFRRPGHAAARPRHHLPGPGAEVHQARPLRGHRHRHLHSERNPRGEEHR